jgi:hypothetical protein
MNKIRRFVYAALLAFTTLNFAPSPVAAQDIAYGRFTLLHEVHWQTAIVPAGDYRFSVEGHGPSSVLVLNKLDGRRAGFMLTAQNSDGAMAGPSRLVLESTPEGSYVTAMQLPEFGLTLHFSAPAVKQIVEIGTTTQDSGQ